MLSMEGPKLALAPGVSTDERRLWGNFDQIELSAPPSPGIDDRPSLLCNAGSS